MQWPYYFFMDNIVEFFKNGPVHPDAFNTNQLIPYYRNDHPEPNDINGALGELLFKEQIFRGICEKLPVIKNVCYTDLRLNLFRTAIDFEVKTWVPFWSKNFAYNRDILLKNFLRFKHLRESVRSNERFYVQLATLVEFTTYPKYVIHTNRLEETLFDILFIFDLEQKKCVFFNEKIKERAQSKINFGNFPIKCFDTLSFSSFMEGAVNGKI